ncbi:MAG: methyltransferase RsmF C-terminal domain-like protein [Phocaeicola sp.]
MPNLPSEFIERTRQLMGEAECNALCRALQADEPVSIRTNTGKNAPAPPQTHPVPWTDNGFYLNRRPAFTFDPLFHAGFYYVQEAASMFIAQAVRRYVNRPVVMLDLCAAPGGKSTLVRNCLPQGSLLVANEVMRARSQVLAENLIKWGNPEVIVTNNDPADFSRLEERFDVILTDVPCSGEGMFRKDDRAISEWSSEGVELCWKRQRRIVADIWPCLKQGGILIYSTCTFNREENEDNVAWIASTLGAEVLPVDTETEWGITGNLTGEDFPVYRFLPHHTSGEGLFVAVLRKKPDSEAGNSCFTGENTRREEADGCHAGNGGEWFADGISPSGDSEEEKPASVYSRRTIAETIYTDAERRGRKAEGFRKGGKGKAMQKGSKVSGVSFPKETEAWIQHAGNFSFRMEDTLAIAIPADYAGFYDELKESLRILHAGITLAELKGKDWMPSHTLAMSTVLCKDAFPQTDLTLAQALSYLRREAIILDSSVPKGYVLVTYRHVPLGFVKNLGNRANNLYPQEWRIRSGYTPEELHPVYENLQE